jgi:hypothetical protein
MSKTFSVNLSNQEQIAFCTKYHCTTNNIARVFKATVTGATHSPWYRDMSMGDISALQLVLLLKRHEEFHTSGETKQVIKNVFGQYIETMKEFLDENPDIKSRVID